MIFYKFYPCALFLFHHPRSASRPPLRFASLKLLSFRRAQHATRRNTTHIDNPTIGAPRFSETCFTVRSRLVLRIETRIETTPYLRKNLRIIIMRNLEAVSAMKTERRRSVGGSQPARSHEHAWRAPRTVTNRITHEKSVAGHISGKRTKKMPEPTNT
jgi:hypothetical protein